QIWRILYMREIAEFYELFCLFKGKVKSINAYVSGHPGKEGVKRRPLKGDRPYYPNGGPLRSRLH
ncbi:MAG: hypothetical protein LBQ42_14425, partial [Synergistaceae bacterium]|nr:hypothetical protein [Synergistaceae bacterium]